MITHERVVILYPWSNRIRARSSSCRAIVTQRWTTSYLLVALYFLISRPQRSTWRLSQEKAPTPFQPLHQWHASPSTKRNQQRDTIVGASPRKCAHMAPGRSTITSVRVPYLRGCTCPIHACIHHCPGT